jgi:uncharacterized membrane protein (UPF0182 family)
MQITEKERLFLAKRAKLVQAWPLIGSVLLCLVIGLGVWLILVRPFLANPFVVFSQLNTHSIGASDLALMAAILPIMVLMCIALTIAIVLFAFVALKNEKRHMAVIQRLVSSTGNVNRDGAVETRAAQQDDAADAGKQRR